MDSTVLKRTSPDKSALSVSELTRLVKNLLESQPALTGIWVHGETSNVRPSPTGHLYFTLKDEQAEVSCVFFAYGRHRKRELAEGTEILAFGDVGLYEKRGVYQLVVRDLIVRGEGELAQEFELLKRKLAAEGLFDEAHKLPLPPLPRAVGIVTSRQAAALADVLKVLKRRAPYLRVILFSALVQGESAPPTIISALRRAQSSGICEVILLVRGGGSLEDLWCFNDEKLARAIYRLRVPLISGVGHEIDFSIADFVADRRAPTPSAAAELVAPDITGLRERVTDCSQQLVSSTLNRLRLALTGFRTVRVGRLLADALGKLRGYEDSLGEYGSRLSRICRRRLELAGEALTEREVRLSPRRVLGRVLERMATLDGAAGGLVASAGRAVELRRQGLQLAQAKLAAVDPQATLSRGYALIWDQTRSRLLRTVDDLAPGETVVGELVDGFFQAGVSQIEAKSSSETKDSEPSG